MAKNGVKIDTGSRPAKGTRKGVKPNVASTPRPGTGRNRPAKGFDPVTKTWNQ